MHFTGAGSMLSPHFRAGPITAPYKASVEEEQMRELFFFDMLAVGMYLARRGMVALMLPVTDADCARFVAAVEEFCAARRRCWPPPDAPPSGLGVANAPVQWCWRFSVQSYQMRRPSTAPM